MPVKDSVKQILDTVRRIPSGSAASYGLVADLAGLPGRARLVGRVLRNAPDNEPVPWQRVLRANGQIAFPKGSRMARQQTVLLREEGVEVKNNRVDMQRFGWKPSLGELMEMDF